MEQALASIVSYLLEHGPWGLMLIGLGYSNYRLNERNDTHTKSIELVQERRSLERETNAQVMAGSAAAQIKLADAVSVLSNKIESLSRDQRETSDKITELGARRAR